MKKLFLVYILLLATIIVQAGVTTYRTKYTGLQLNNNAPALKLEDDYFSVMLANPEIPGPGNGGWDDDFVNKSVKNRIKLVYIGGEKEHAVNVTDWLASVTFDVEVRDETNAVVSTLLGQTLSISNNAVVLASPYPNPTSNNESILELNTSGYYLSISNFTFNGLPSTSIDFELILEIETERYFTLPYQTPFSYTQNFHHAEVNINNSVCSTVSPTQKTWDNKLRVYWGYILGAEEYELEWYFNSAENGIQYSQILAGPNPANLPEDIPSLEWTRVTTTNNDYQINLPYDDGILFYRVRPVGRFLADCTKKYYADWSPVGEYQVHNNELKKNWQYSATYAEEGKVKEVVSYFDGSGRNRQAVTRSSTDNTSLITETMYDYEGRPVIQTLPAPNLNRSQNLGFHCDYSLNNVNNLLAKEDYDYFQDCDLNAPLLGINEGASNYYSPNNPENGVGENQVIPDAEQYPYTQTVIGRDGRVKYQSAPGKKHSITDNGTVTDNKFTKFAYATPLQYKLDRLFGNEVGYASHYKVKAVEDANGQISLSYLDLSENVVATSLIGEEPSNLNALPSNSGPGQVQADFNNLNNYSSATESYVINSSFLVEVVGPHTFNYSLTPEVVASLCGSPDYGCVYDLEITIYDDCDRKIYDSGLNTSGDPYDNAQNTVLHTQYITINASNAANLTGDFVVNFNEIGTYTIKKELKLNQAALDAAVQDFKDNYAPGCLPPFNLPIDADDCLDCEEFCALPASSCDVDECTVHYKGCDLLFDQLVADMSPGGQYFDKNFSTPLPLSANSYHWLQSYVALGYDDYPITQVHQIWADMGFYIPNTTTLITDWPTLALYWQPSWATKTFTNPISNSIYSPSGISSLVEAHPEYCHYTTCVAMEPSLQFNQDFSVESTLPTLFHSGSITGLSQYTYANLQTVIDQMILNDPFFNGISQFVFVDMQSGVDPSGPTNIYVNINSAGNNLYQDIDNIVNTNFSGAFNINDVWTIIKSAYLERKHLWVKLFKESQDCYFLLDYKDGVGTIGVFDNIAESFMPPLFPLFPTFFLNDDAFYHFQPKFIAQANSNGLPLGIYDDVMHELYFSGFQIREPDYTDFFALGVGSGMPGFPTSMPAWGNNFGNNLPSSPCGQLISCQDLNISCGLGSSSMDWIEVDAGLGTPVDKLKQIQTTPLNYFQFIAFIASQSGFDYSPGLFNQLNTPVVPGETYTFTAEIRNTVPGQLYDLKIGLTNTTSFDEHVQSSTYGPDASTVLLGTVPNVANSQWSTITFTYTATQNYNFLVVYMDGFQASDHFLDIRNIKLNKQCVVEEWNCFCTQIDLAEQVYALDNNLTLPLTGGDLTAFQNNLANEFNNNYPSLTVTITGSNVAEWMSNCGETTDPNINGVGNPPMLIVPEVINCAEDSCLEQSINIANYYNSLFNQQIIDSLTAYFIEQYKLQCFGGTFDENFTVEYEDREYHFTLYYYDRAGNLQRTIAPQGVDQLLAASTQAVDNYRTTLVGSPVYPNHKFETKYLYNTLNQLISQTTPDAGDSKFYYDDIGRLKASQNAKQAMQNPKRYSYTVYDAQGRIIEVGELESNSIPSSIELNDPNFPQLWIGATDRYQVTYTQYDETLNTTINGLFGANGQQNLRSRVASIFLKAVSSDVDWKHAYHYSYDIHGNVKKLITDNPTQSNYGQQYKTLDYEYDLISGNVNKVSYQKGKMDQYHHKYCYDADNRIIKAFTSQDDLIWENDADYFYYLHGPLARTEIGDDKVQGMDYAYTIHGWLKGVNTNRVDPTFLQSDIGKDGIVGANFPYYASIIDVHDNVAQDAYGFNLSYYDNDFNAISTNGNNFLTDITSLNLNAPRPDGLFNGNIRQMATSLTDLQEDYMPLQATNYRYDQLNRLASMQANTVDDLTTNNYFSATTNQYNTSYSYDANGNLVNLNRRASSNALMDNLDYNYYLNGAGDPTNKLEYVIDSYGFQNFNDLHTQNPTNYRYDEIGNLVADDVEEIKDIKWNVYGKIESIIRIPASTKPDLVFEYDASGNRIKKTIKDATDVDESDWEHYHYQRDASGNIMAIYKQTFTNIAPNVYKSLYKLIENPIYGSSRIGNQTREMEYTSVFVAQIGSNGEFEPYTPVVVTNPTGNTSTLRTVYTDDSFDVLTNGADLDLTVYSSNPLTVYGGPFTNVVGAENVGADYIQIGANKVVNFSTNVQSTFSTQVNTQVEILGNNIFTVQRLGSLTAVPLVKFLNKKYKNQKGTKVYELTNHLGNVLATVTDRKISEDVNFDNTTDYFTSDVISFSDYYPFGALMPGRNASSGDYRYGFTGLEKDDEVKSSTGNSYTTEYRQYDPRVGRWLSMDALASKFPFYTPYQYAGNKPIVAVDLDGLEDVWVHNFEQEDGSIIAGSTTYEVGEKSNEVLSDLMGFQLPKTGAVTTVKRNDGTYEIVNYQPTFNVVAEKPKAKEQKWYEKSWYGSSDNPYEGSRGFHERGGKEVFIASITLPISVAATIYSGGSAPAAFIGWLGVANNVDDLTSDGESTFITRQLPAGGGVLKTSISAANFFTGGYGLIDDVVKNTGNAANNADFGLQLLNTSIDEVQTIQGVAKELEPKPEEK